MVNSGSLLNKKVYLKLSDKSVKAIQTFLSIEKKKPGGLAQQRNTSTFFFKLPIHLAFTTLALHQCVIVA